MLSKCIAAVPNVVFLSEMHPLAYLNFYKPQASYYPTDIIQELSMLRNGASSDVCKAVFRGSILALHNELRKNHQMLVLRSHSHVDFFLPSGPQRKPVLSEMFARDFRVIDVMTVRHPLDSWLSFRANGWNEIFEISSLSAFSDRCVVMLRDCSWMPRVKFEEFCDNPKAQLALLCHYMLLPLNDSALCNFSQINLSGDSGRRSDRITLRGRRPLRVEDRQAACSSVSYSEVCSLLGYNPDPDASWPF